MGAYGATSISHRVVGSSAKIEQQLYEIENQYFYFYSLYHRKDAKDAEN